MNDNNHLTIINEIEGEIASLRITLKMTSDPKRKKELEEDIKDLEEQLSQKRMKNKGNVEKKEDESSTNRDNFSNNNIKKDYYSFDRNHDYEER